MRSCSLRWGEGVDFGGGRNQLRYGRRSFGLLLLKTVLLLPSGMKVIQSELNWHCSQSELKMSIKGGWIRTRLEWNCRRGDGYPELLSDLSRAFWPRKQGGR